MIDNGLLERKITEGSIESLSMYKAESYNLRTSEITEDDIKINNIYKTVTHENPLSKNKPMIKLTDPLEKEEESYILKKNLSVPLLLQFHLFPIQEVAVEDEETFKNAQKNEESKGKEESEIFKPIPFKRRIRKRLYNKKT
mmetsp:Transcript_29987/g.26559  ORF Transcript_29987/g.26559 Transcript_29987/m.26559 type:complete len:141 (+) Transcript_29987:3-425(+)